MRRRLWVAGAGAPDLRGALLRRDHGGRVVRAGPVSARGGKAGLAVGGRVQAGADGSLSRGAAIKPGAAAGFSLYGRATSQAGALVGSQTPEFQRGIRQALSGRALRGTLGGKPDPRWEQTARVPAKSVALGCQRWTGWLRCGGDLPGRAPTVGD